MPSMKKMRQQDIAEKARLSQSMLSMILSGRRRAGWKSAKSLANATGTDPVLWLEGSAEQIKEAISQQIPERTAA